MVVIDQDKQQVKRTDEDEVQSLEELYNRHKLSTFKTSLLLP
jgi:hypothetical protein